MIKQLKTLLVCVLCIAAMKIQGQLPQYVWSGAFLTDVRSTTQEVQTDAAGNVYIQGTFYGTMDADPGVGTYNLVSTGNASNGDMYLIKLNSSGIFQWAKHWKGNGNEIYATDMKVDPSGNSYSMARYKGTCNLDPNNLSYFSTSAGGRDNVICKLDAAGNTVWIRTFGGISNEDYGYWITVTSSGLYIGGGYAATVDFDPSPTGTALFTAFSDQDMFLCKWNLNGEYEWAKMITGSTTHGRSVMGNMTFDAVGNIYVSGYFSGTKDFDPGPGVANLTSNGDADALVAKYDASGNYIWAGSFGGAGFDAAYGVVLDNSGHVYFSGNFTSTADFDIGAGTHSVTTNGVNDMFILKLNESGSFSKLLQFGGTGQDYSGYITNDHLGNLYLAVSFSNTVDFDPGVGTTNLTSNGAIDGAIIKLDNTDQLVWARSFGGTANDLPNTSIIVDNTNGFTLVTGGYFVGTMDLNPGIGVNNVIGNSGFSNAFVLKWSLDGLPDLTPTVDMENLPFSLAAPGSTHDFITNIFEIGGADALATSGDIVFTISKPSAFDILVPGLTLTSSFQAGSDGSSIIYGSTINHENSKWLFRDAGTYIEVKYNASAANLGIVANGGSKVGFVVKPKSSGVPPFTVQNISPTIQANSGGQTNFANDIVTVSVSINE